MQENRRKNRIDPAAIAAIKLLARGPRTPTAIQHLVQEAGQTVSSSYIHRLVSRVRSGLSAVR